MKSMQKTTGAAQLKLRIAVEGGGCSGFQYKFSTEEASPSEDDRYNKYTLFKIL